MLLQTISDFEMFSQLVALFGAQIGLQGRRVVDELNFLAFVVDGSAFVVQDDGRWTIDRNERRHGGNLRRQLAQTVCNL